MNLEELLEFVENHANLHVRKVETTILNIGGRGYYENPFSDLLAFFLDPNSDHTLGNLVLASLLDLLGQDVAQWPRELNGPPIRESIGRIDIVLKGPGWAIALENKIRHLPNNPFGNYAAAFNAAAQDVPCDMRKYVILAPYEINIAGWIWIDTRKFLDKIRENVDLYFPVADSSKWPTLLRELLTTIEGEVEPIMDDTTFCKIGKEYIDFCEVMRTFDSFKQSLSRRLIQKVAEESFEIQVNNEQHAIHVQDIMSSHVAEHQWTRVNATAFRVYQKGGRANASLVFFTMPQKNNLNYRLQIYTLTELPEVEMNQNSYGSRGTETERGMTLYVYSRDFNNLDDALEEFGKALVIVSKSVIKN
jgi:hypothetical protein